ncbi:hypothetical protein PoB_001164800 [Plakobranchus ocellatus]|uniref:Uncharacterized protein n=1 Tax=Plakobranchus ocellatus TaxID=259542 RepID=A0AAV3YRE5_9GAST|nr:hypothetical protein PoB_001164800 [Plakobranchus ocellatus]
MLVLRYSKAIGAVAHLVEQLATNSNFSISAAVLFSGGVGGTVASESTLRSARTHQLRVRSHHQRPDLMEGPKANERPVNEK